ncbi:MAG: hypothetical protein G8345_01145 [Magnetococcales bacterium]|nr:hypothetical protein [Magnetococcales bacterium]NGZ25476.1 hypothetical protein [Magnetococcales bacterium]
MKYGHRITTFLITAATLCGIGGAVAASLTTKPLYLSTRVDPNIFFLIDDSLSMDLEITTQPYWYYTAYWGTGTGATWEEEGYWTVNNSTSTKIDYSYWHNNADNNSFLSYYDGTTLPLNRDWRVRSSSFNITYYNPTVTYLPWPGFSDASFTAVRSNPQSGTTGYSATRDLTGLVYEVVTDDAGYGGNCSGSSVTAPAGKTDYYSCPSGNGVIDIWDKHVRYTVNNGSITKSIYDYSANTVGDDGTCGSNNCIVPTITTTSLADTDEYGRTLAQTKQNIANWYQYYRRRSMTVKGTVGFVVANNPNYRYGLSTINTSNANNPKNNLFVEMPSFSVDNYSSQNDTMLDTYYKNTTLVTSTPLRLGLEMVGKYYGNTLSGRTSPITNSCQQNFTILFTDGYWNDSSPSIGDSDGDGLSNSLADVASYYYKTDLRTDLTNNVPTSTSSFPPDDASWQHMVTFGIAFGVKSTLTDTDGDGWPNNSSTDTSNPADGKPDYNGNWNDPFCTPWCSEKIDDLWHATFNGRGTFSSAANPTAVQAAMEAAVTNISVRTSSAASASLNTATLSDATRLYQSNFNSGDWTGDLIAYPIILEGDDRGQVDSDNPDWSARDQLDNQNYNTGRNIITFNTTSRTGVAFRWANISATQQGYLNTNPDSGATDANGSSRLDYLRGNTSNEGTGATQFRNRNHILGDTINSDPTYVGSPSMSFPTAFNTTEKTAYDTFKTTYANRTPMIYFGGNDGMLHAINANTGQEALAYVPGKLYSKLTKLTSKSYTHQYFVDGKITVTDAYGNFPRCSSQPCWRTVLVSGLGAGGQGMFALDVTDPTAFLEANASSLVLWEFTDDQDSTGGGDSNRYSLGNTMGQASIVRMDTGSWVAVFGNGYHSYDSDSYATASDTGALYFLNIATGAILKRIVPTGATGMAAPSLVDTDSDGNVEYAYAGDLSGKLWKFDLTGNSSSQWKVALTGSPLFTATPPTSSNPNCPVSYSYTVDNSDAASVTSSSGWTTLTDTPRNGANFLRTQVNNAYFQWTFPAVTTSGSHTIYAYWKKYSTGGTRSDTSVTYTISYGSTSSSVSVDQRNNGDAWVSLTTIVPTAGNVVTVRVTSDNASDYVVADAVKLEYIGTSVASAQPITVYPEIGVHPKGSSYGYMIYFGTGKFFESGDNAVNCAATQSFYGIRDKDASLTRSNLLQQVISNEQSVTAGDETYSIRTVTDNTIDWSTKDGWYLDLALDSDGDGLVTDEQNYGEKVIYHAILTGGTIIFTSALSPEDKCATSGESGWLYELDYENGGRLAQSFDLNNDSQFNDSDKVTITEGDQSINVTGAGKKSAVGIPTAPSILKDEENSKKIKYTTGSTGGTPEATSNSATATATKQGRQSWRQIFID